MLQASNWHQEIRANWPCLSAILISRLETLHLKLLESFDQKNFLSNCSKQLVTPVNLTRKKFHELCIQFAGLGARSQSQKTAFYRGHFSHCELPEITDLKPQNRARF